MYLARELININGTWNGMISLLCKDKGERRWGFFLSEFVEDEREYYNL
jgi:hypothetical protein